MAVGDAVVYAGHGVGRVVARKRLAGAEQECVILELWDGLRVTLPLSEAASRLRAVADEREITAVRRTLSSPPADRDAQWSKRIRDTKAKLATGGALDLAELVRDGKLSEQGRNGARLSQGERQIYLRARTLLVGELCSARGVVESEADAWIDAQIDKSGA
jgi:CarD family transcriptional regulator